MNWNEDALAWSVLGIYVAVLLGLVIYHLGWW